MLMCVASFRSAWLSKREVRTGSSKDYSVISEGLAGGTGQLLRQFDAFFDVVITQFHFQNSTKGFSVPLKQTLLVGCVY
jgi:hypothetical protein